MSTSHAPPDMRMQSLQEQRTRACYDVLKMRCSENALLPWVFWSRGSGISNVTDLQRYSQQAISPSRNVTQSGTKKAARANRKEKAKKKCLVALSCLASEASDSACIENDAPAIRISIYSMRPFSIGRNTSNACSPPLSEKPNSLHAVRRRVSLFLSLAVASKQTLRKHDTVQ